MGIARKLNFLDFLEKASHRCHRRQGSSG